jgi:hypothetical protein
MLCNALDVLFLRAEGFFCSLETSYGGLGIGNSFFPILVIKTLDPNRIRTRIGSGSVFSLDGWIRIRIK